MPVVEITISGPEYLSPDALPINIGFETPEIGWGGTPPIPIKIGDGPFDYGVKATFICPGWPACGIDEACQQVYKSRIASFDPSKLIPTKIPGIPALPKFPKYKFSTKFPSRPFWPFDCPAYPNKSEFVG